MSTLARPDGCCHQRLLFVLMGVMLAANNVARPRHGSPDWHRPYESPFQTAMSPVMVAALVIPNVWTLVVNARLCDIHSVEYRCGKNRTPLVNSAFPLSKLHFLFPRSPPQRLLILPPPFDEAWVAPKDLFFCCRIDCTPHQFCRYLSHTKPEHFCSYFFLALSYLCYSGIPLSLRLLALFVSPHTPYFGVKITINRLR
jgi:hypothetical protein